VHVLDADARHGHRRLRRQWVEDVDERRRVFELFTTTPPPLGYPLDYLGAERWENPCSPPLRLDACGCR
jgi:hypothetical protein